jgi:type II secretory pathway pseudopilin PulG
MNTRRGGFTLVEMLMAMTLTMIIFSAAIPFFRIQVRALGVDAARMEARQAGRFSSDVLDRELHAAGLGISEQQPAIIAAHPRSITFNADLVTLDSNDVSAAFYDPSADLAAVKILPRDRAVSLPLVGMTYPLVTYKAKVGDAETISFWAARDSGDSRPDHYVLYRRVNDRPPTVVVRNVILRDGEAVFRYFRTDSANRLIELTGSQLPLLHTEPLHGTPADTGRGALIDSLRVIRVKLAIKQATAGARGDSIQRVERSTTLGNAIQQGGGGSCGGAPGMTLLTATPGPATAQVTLTWSPSPDESGGERDVERYVVYRRSLGSASFGVPLASVPAGLSTYSFLDRSVRSGESWTYGLLAQDCAGANSGLSTSTAVVP